MTRWPARAKGRNSQKYASTRDGTDPSKRRTSVRGQEAKGDDHVEQRERSVATDVLDKAPDTGKALGGRLTSGFLVHRAESREPGRSADPPALRNPDTSARYVVRTPLMVWGLVKGVEGPARWRA
jgi:hypothetical protein